MYHAALASSPGEGRCVFCGVFASVAALRFPRPAERKAKPLRSFGHALRRVRLSMRTKPPRRTTWMHRSKLSGLITKKRTRWTAPRPIGRKSISATCAALKSASTITLRAHISAATRKKALGGKTTCASQTKTKWAGFRRWPWRAARVCHRLL